MSEQTDRARAWDTLDRAVQWPPASKDLAIAGVDVVAYEFARIRAEAAETALAAVREIGNRLLYAIADESNASVDWGECIVCSADNLHGSVETHEPDCVAMEFKRALAPKGYSPLIGENND